MRRVLFLGTALALFGASMAEAADSKERFQAYGLGRLTCKRFVEVCDTKKEDCQVVAPTWFEGYLTGFNALFDDTYDILPWQPPGILADGWTTVTRDRSLSAQFEHTVGVTEDGVEVFTLSPKGYDKPPYPI